MRENECEKLHIIIDIFSNYILIFFKKKIMSIKAKHDKKTQILMENLFEYVFYQK